MKQAINLAENANKVKNSYMIYLNKKVYSFFIGVLKK